MSDEPGNLVLQLLRKLDARMTIMAEDMHDLKVRVTSVLENMAVLDRRVERIDWIGSSDGSVSRRSDMNRVFQTRIA